MARRSAQHSMAQRSAQYLMATTACGARLQAGSLSLGSTLDSTLSGLGSLALVCLKLDSGRDWQLALLSTHSRRRTHGELPVEDHSDGDCDATVPAGGIAALAAALPQ